MKALSYLSFIICIIASSACKDFLDVKPDGSLATTNSVKALKAMLDFNYTINQTASGLGEACADDYYLREADYNRLSSEQRETYIWGAHIQSETAYSVMYQKINIANTVLDELSRLKNIEAHEASFIKGSALFIRANAYLTLANAFALQYNKATAENDMGVPLRLNANFNEKSERASVEETYMQIERDAVAASRLLPDIAEHPMRPSKSAAFALLSRLYLSMTNYEGAERYADSCLVIHSGLMDYNTLDSNLRYPIPRFSKEVIYHINGSSVGFVFASYAKIDEGLISLYEENDLRKGLFFFTNPDNTRRFKGSYYGSLQPFVGYAADEVYLNKAECLARKGVTQEALDVLNTLLVNRYDNETFVKKTASDPAEALTLILTERRKELVMRDIRWMDIKRLNLEPVHQITLIRTIGNQTFELEPNDNRFALPFPQSVIDISGVPQNPR